MSSNEKPDNPWIKRIEEAIPKYHFKLYDYKNFNDIREISSGSLGKVYSANYKNTHKQVILKSFVGLNNAVVGEILYEFKLQHEIDFHDNVYLYGVTISDLDNSSSNYMIVTEYADGGTLRDYLKKNFNNLTWNDKLILALQLACVVARLHDEGIAHHDLHDGSLLVHRNSIKLADFGLSKRIDKTSIGIIPYVDPKRFNKQKDAGNSTQIYSLNAKSDVYGVGVLLWELSSGRPPFIDNKSYDDSLAVEILQGLREAVIPNTPDDYVKLYTECWDGNPDNRPSMSEVVRRLKTIISQTSVKIHQQPKENFNNITTNVKIHQQPKENFNNLTTNVQKFDKTNEVNSFKSMIVVDNIFKLINEGNESEIKNYIIGYLCNYNINLQMIYGWIMDQSDKSNPTFLLGSIYYFGVKVKIDFKKAFELFTVAASKGHLLAQYFIGLCYEFGNGTAKDVKTAFSYYKKIAEVNCAVGEFKVGFFYDKGIGIKKDSKMAAHWYKKAADNGNFVARYILAKMYKNGDGIDKDYFKAFELFKKLAEKDPKGIPYCQKALELYQQSVSLENSVA